MRATIYQPQYFPRLHYFNRILNSDIFIILDSAQFTKTLVHLTQKGRERHSSYQSATPIKTASGNILLSIPIKHNGLQPINSAQIDYTKEWNTKHLAIIEMNYRKADVFPTVFPDVKELLSHQYSSLSNLNIATILFGLNHIFDFRISPNELSIPFLNQKLKKEKTIRLKEFILADELNIPRPEGLQKGTEWTVAILKKVEADEYYFGATAKDGYMDLEFYKKKGIKTVLQNWSCRQYLQQYEKVGFIPNLSILDLIFNTKQEYARNILSGLQ